MKKLIMFLLIFSTSFYVFAFEGTSYYGTNKDNIGFGVGYQIHTLILDNDFYNIYGYSLNFKREFSLRSNANSTMFFDSNIIIPYTSSSIQNGLIIDDSLVGVNSSDILFVDYIIGSNYYSFETTNITSYMGAGFHSYYMFYNDILEQSTILYGFGLSLDSGIQYYINDTTIFEFETSGTFDFINYKEVENIRSYSDFIGINIRAKAALINRY